MNFGLSPDLLASFPEACVGVLVVTDLRNRPSTPAEVAILRAAEAEARAGLGASEAKMHPSVAAWRQRFEAAGINPNKFRISVEALLSRIGKGDELPTINALVDLVNSVSVKYALPAGAHDIGTDRGDIWVRHARAGESFQPMGAAETEVVPEGEIVYADSVGVRTRRWVWRQSSQTRVDESVTAALIPIDGFVGVTDADVREAMVELADLIRTHLGATVAPAFLDAASPTVPLDLDAALVLRGLVPAVHVANGPQGASDPITELLSRNVVDVIARAELEKRLRSGEKLRVKFGIDPTGPKIHIGRAVPLRKLKQFQDLGHQIVLIIGDFTAQIGDASDKLAARQMLTPAEVEANMHTYLLQMGKILDTSKLELTHNSDWLGKLGFREVVQLASNFTVAQMLERENFTERYSTNKPIGLHEFMYPLMQGYDSVVVRADVEVGGTDQLFNLMAGRELQRAAGQRPQDIVLTQLIPGTDGRKMSTSWGNTITVVDDPGTQFGRLMSVSDDLIVPYLVACTDVPMAEIRELEAAMARDGLNPISAKKRLAYEVVALYHGIDAATEARGGFERTVQNKEVPDEMPTFMLVPDLTLVDLLANSGLVPSRGEARRLVEQGGVSLDGEKLTDIRGLMGKPGVLKAGKRRYLRLVVQ